MASEYEAIRQKNIANNLAILASLGLERPAPPPSIAKTFKPSKSGSSFTTRSLKRRALDSDDGISVPSDELEGVRRKSARLSGRIVRSRKIASDSESSTDSGSEYEHSEGEEEGSRQHRRKRTSSKKHNLEAYEASDEEGFRRRTVSGRLVASSAPKANMQDVEPIYGAIEGVEIGAHFHERRLAALANIHRPWVSGIHGHRENGCYSVALSGGYEDDLDEGFRFTFTGSGGRELRKKNLRTAPQSCDQPLNINNLSLIRSYELRKPVRVLRGFKGRNEWSPATGYRYDGLYMVEKWWQDKGLSGFKVYRYAFKRVDGQAPLKLEPTMLKET